MGFIVWLIIVIVIISTIKKSNANANDKKRPVNRPMNNMGSVPGRNFNNQQGIPGQNQQRTMVTGQNQQRTTVTGQNGQQRTTVSGQSPLPHSWPGSGTDQNKYSLDRDKFQYNGNCAARYEEWQEVPRGCSVVTCNYCGATNLVPLSGRKNYQCYFCWKNL